MTCSMCNGSGIIGDKGYWVYCSCKAGDKLRGTQSNRKVNK